MPRLFIADIHQGESALVATAIHAGSRMRDDLLERCALTHEQRLREEDPFTDQWTTLSDNRIIGLRSRFEVDLNRPREKAVYRTPDEAWGLQVWRSPLQPVQLERSLADYDAFHDTVAGMMDRLLQRHPYIIVYDLHSYNHQRGGPSRADDPALNPEFNIGTANMDRDHWASVVDALMESLRQPWDGTVADVRENVRFKGGHFTLWLHERYGARVCPIAIEVKKTFMDEWTGAPDAGAIWRIKNMLMRSVDPVMQAAHAIQELERSSP